MISEPKTFRSVYFILVVISVLYVFNFQKNGNSNDGFKSNIHSDGSGYYAYLPAVLIYHDLNFGFINQLSKTYPGSGLDDFATDKNAETHFNKYFPGEAILLLPFFLIACLLSFISGHAVDGYSFYFQIAVAAAGLFYFLSGLYFSHALISKLIINRLAIFLSLFLFAVGSNLLYYAVDEPSASHVYSFFLIAVFFNASINFFKTPCRKNILIVALSYALILLTRPTDFVVLGLFPFAAGNWHDFKKQISVFLKHHTKYFSLTLLLSILIIAIHPVLFFIQTGTIGFYSYGEEYFEFLNPHLSEVHFGFRKGLFIYTPLAFLALFGLIPIYRRNRLQFYSLLLTLVTAGYIIASWYCWPYGGCFGMRPYVDFYVLFILMLAFLFSHLVKTAFVILVSVCTLLAFYNQFQLYQYRSAILAYDNMDFERYKRIFLCTDKKLSDVFAKHPTEINPDKIVMKYSFENNFDTNIDWGFTDYYTQKDAWSKPNACLVDSVSKYSPTFQYVFSDSNLVMQYNFFLKVSCMLKCPSDFYATYLVAEISRGDSIIYYDAYPVIGSIAAPNEWKDASVLFRVQNEIKCNDRLRIYLFTNDRLVLIDNLKSDIIFCKYLAVI